MCYRRFVNRRRHTLGLFKTKPLEAILEQPDEPEHALKRTLGPFSLVALGIGAVIGAGIFTLAGKAAADYAGPAVVYTFILCAIGCGFAGLCYSEFATMIPIAGSAYTYAYSTMGELLAWIIGWDLVLEYAIGAATVSVGWSGHVLDLLRRFGIDFPLQYATSPFETFKLADGTLMHGVANIPAALIIVIISVILIIGIRESAGVNSLIVVGKVMVVVIFIALGWAYINPANHHPFLPPNTGTLGQFGWSGVLRASGLIFFAYIGFDAVSTAAQETKNPKRDMPIGIIGSLIVCTVLFILYAYVLTGVVNYHVFQDPRYHAAPITAALARMPFPILSMLMDLAIIAGLTSVMLVMLLGQSRVFYSMSRDGLLPRIFSDVHPKFRTPWRSNILMMIFVGIFSAVVPIDLLGEMTSIGTLFAFIIVCGGIIILRKTRPDVPRAFKTPFVPLVPIVGIFFNLVLICSLGIGNWIRLFIWLALGLAVYFGYSRHHSKLTATAAPTPVRTLGD